MRRRVLLGKFNKRQMPSRIPKHSLCGGGRAREKEMIIKRLKSKSNLLWKYQSSGSGGGGGVFQTNQKNRADNIIYSFQFPEIKRFALSQYCFSYTSGRTTRHQLAHYNIFNYKNFSSCEMPPFIHTFILIAMQWYERRGNYVKNSFDDLPSGWGPSVW